MVNSNSFYRAYELSDHTMVLYGLCADCRKKSAG